MVDVTPFHAPLRKTFCYLKMKKKKCRHETGEKVFSNVFFRGIHKFLAPMHIHCERKLAGALLITFEMQAT
jgi:hypothetical protein